MSGITLNIQQVDLLDVQQVDFIENEDMAMGWNSDVGLSRHHFGIGILLGFRRPEISMCQNYLITYCNLEQ